MVVGSPTKLNLIPSGVMPVVYINQGDAGYDKEFLIYNGDSPYNVPAGVSATIRGKKADGYGVTEAATLTEGSNLVTVTITEQMVAAAGENLYELVFVDTDDLRIATINIVWAVKADALGDAMISDSDLDYATEVMNKLQSVAAFKNQQDANIANISANAESIEAEAAARIAADNTLQAAISAEASARATKDNSLQSQINQLVAPSGSAPSAAEVQNARIGANGNTYSTLGDAIREQVSELRDDINKKMLRICTSTTDWYLSSARPRTNRIDATQYGLYIKYDTGYRVYVQGYNADGTEIYNRNAWYTDNKDIILPKGAYYELQFQLATGAATALSEISHIYIYYVNPTIPAIYSLISPENFTVGNWNSATANVNKNVHTRICTNQLFHPEKDGYIFMTNQDYVVYQTIYTLEGERVSDIGWTWGAGYLISSEYKYGFSIRKNTEDGVVIDEGSELFYEFANSIYIASNKEISIPELEDSLNERIDDINDQLGQYSEAINDAEEYKETYLVPYFGETKQTEFEWANASHSSTLNKIDIDIPAGTPFDVFATTTADTTVRYSILLYDSNGTYLGNSGTNAFGATRRFVLDYSAAQVGIYFDALGAASTITLKVKTLGEYAEQSDPTYNGSFISSDGITRIYRKDITSKKLYIQNEQGNPSCNQQGACYEDGKVVIATTASGGDGYSGCTLDVWDFETATRLYSINVPNDITGHGNNVIATGVKYDNTDIFSILMISNLSPSNLVVARITQNGGFDLLNYYQFDPLVVGYRANFMYNEANGTIVSIGFKIDNAETPNGNEMIISVWDIANWNVKNSAATPTMRYSFNLPYMDIINGCIIRNGIMYVMCTPFQFDDYTYVAVLPIETKSVTNRISIGSKVEHENINFISDDTMLYGAYWFYVSRFFTT